jgi:hypothetical protein
MKVVLRALAAHADLRAASTGRERTRPTVDPARPQAGGEVIRERAATADRVAA